MLTIVTTRPWRVARSLVGKSSAIAIRVAGLFYSLIESAKLAGVEQWAYLGETAQRAIRWMN
jgi:hypothetical protein